MYYSYAPDDPTTPQAFDDSIDYAQSLFDYASKVPQISVYTRQGGENVQIHAVSEGFLSHNRLLTIPSGCVPFGATVKWLRDSCIIVLGWLAPLPPENDSPFQFLFGDPSNPNQYLSDISVDTPFIELARNDPDELSFVVVLPPDFPIGHVSIPRQSRLSQERNVEESSKHTVKQRDRNTDFMMGDGGPAEIAHLVPARVPKSAVKAVFDKLGARWNKEDRDRPPNLVLFQPTIHKSVDVFRLAFFPGDRIYPYAAYPYSHEFQPTVLTCVQAHKINKRQASGQIEPEPQDRYTMTWPSLLKHDYRRRQAGPDARALSLAYAAFILRRFAPGADVQSYWTKYERPVPPRPADDADDAGGRSHKASRTGRNQDAATSSRTDPAGDNDGGATGTKGGGQAVDADAFLVKSQSISSRGARDVETPLPQTPRSSLSQPKPESLTNSGTGDSVSPALPSKATDNAPATQSLPASRNPSDEPPPPPYKSLDAIIPLSSERLETYIRVDCSEDEDLAPLLDIQEEADEQHDIMRAACAMEIIRQAHEVISWIQKQSLDRRVAWGFSS